MRIHFTGRHVEVTAALEASGRDRLEKLQRFLPGILEAHIILSVEKYRHRAEVNLHTRHDDLSAVQETGDMYSSLSQVFDKLERQALKLKDKVKSRKRRAAGAQRAVEAGVERAAQEDTRRVREDQSAAGARRRVAASPRLVREGSTDLKPMSVEDAVLQVQESERGFVVFRNSRSQRVSVIYRRSDGRYGVIEP